MFAYSRMYMKLRHCRSHRFHSPFTKTETKAIIIVFQVIIDNMMNLEILWVAYGLTGNETLRHIVCYLFVVLNPKSLRCGLATRSH
ncbi:hypothetical protein C8R44DRAFT_789328 [Mycena epipterygia]|nr:hypothetical protein C8R44DRAFT_789328 [Mycena epipterygia]